MEFSIVLTYVIAVVHRVHMNLLHSRLPLPNAEVGSAFMSMGQFKSAILSYTPVALLLKKAEETCHQKPLLHWKY